MRNRSRTERARPATAVAVAAACALVAVPAGAQPAGPDPDELFGDPWLSAQAARLEALDKVTGRISVLEVVVDEPTRFGTLDIVMRACHRRPPELPPDSAAFLQITEQRGPTDPAERLFSGWMFASSPGLSALEHPVYDVIVLECLRPRADDLADQSAAGDASASATQSGSEPGDVVPDDSSE